MVTIIFGVIGFTVIILALVLVLMLARDRLVPSGDVQIDVEIRIKELSRNHTVLNALRADRTHGNIRVRDAIDPIRERSERKDTNYMASTIAHRHGCEIQRDHPI